MRYIAFLIFTSALSVAWPQTQWVHDRFISFPQGVSISTWWPWGPNVNRDGIPVFDVLEGNVGGRPQAYRGELNINRWYLGPDSQGQRPFINDSGQVAYMAYTALSHHVMVDGRDFFAEVFPPTNDLTYSASVRGIDSFGRPIWYWSDNNSKARVFRGTEEMSVGRDVWDPLIYSVNHNGDFAWWAYVDTPDGKSLELFRNEVAYASPILGDGFLAYPGYLNNVGDMLWAGRGAATAGVEHLFLNETNLTEGRVVGQRSMRANAINDRGDIAWRWHDSSGLIHVMLNWRDLTNEVFGAANRGSRTEVYLSEAGDLAWVGSSRNPSYTSIYLNTENLSASEIGATTEVGDGVFLKGIDRFSNVLWDGAGEGTAHRMEVFVNKFCLSRDALGDMNYRSATAMAIGQNGHVLWCMLDWEHNTHVYLSTIVPEPSGLLLVGVGLLPLMLRRKT